MRLKLYKVMKYIKKLSLLALLVALGTLLNSCLKKKYELTDVEGSDWNPTLAIPLLNSNLTVYNVLQKIDDNHVQTASDGFVSLVYEGDLVINPNDSFVTVPNQSINYSLNLPADNATASTALTTAPFGTTVNVPTVTNPFGLTVNPSSVDIYKIRFKTGEVRVDIVNSFDHEVNVTIGIPDLTGTSGAFSQTITVPANSSAPTQIFNINNTTLNVGSGDNNIDINYTSTFTSSGNGNGIGMLDVSLSIENFEYGSIEANFGQRNFDWNSQDVLLKIFEDASGGTFQILNPKISMDISNSVGIPFQFDFANNLIINSTADNTQEPLAFTSPAEGLLKVASPASLTAASTFTNKTYTKVNVTNINNLTNSTPKYFTYHPFFSLNPDGGVSETNPNFITDTSNIRIHGEVELPMEGYAYNYDVLDTVPFDGLTLTEEEIIKVIFRTGTDNSFPIDIRFQLTFLDANYNPIDSLFEDFNSNFIDAAEVGANGRVVKDANGKYITKGMQIKDIEYDRTRVEKLADAAYILLRAEANSINANATAGTNSPTIRLYDDYNVNVRLSVKMDLSVKP